MVQQPVCPVAQARVLMSLVSPHSALASDDDLLNLENLFSLTVSLSCCCCLVQAPIIPSWMTGRLLSALEAPLALLHLGNPLGSLDPGPGEPGPLTPMGPLWHCRGDAPAGRELGWTKWRKSVTWYLFLSSMTLPAAALP